MADPQLTGPESPPTLGTRPPRLPPPAHQAPAHPAPPPPHQRQSRAVHPHPPCRLGIRRHLRHLTRTHRRPRRLALHLQSHPTTRQPRPPPADTPATGPHREQRPWVVQL